VGVGVGAVVARGKVVGIAVGVEPLLVTVWDAPQAARKQRQKTTNISSKHRFIRYPTFSSYCDAIGANRIESRP
jgi:hypothetical protein